MTQEFIRKSLELTAEQWQRLERIAAELNINAPTGPRAGKPSWRTLVKLLADGRLIIVREIKNR